MGKLAQKLTAHLNEVKQMQETTWEESGDVCRC